MFEISSNGLIGTFGNFSDFLRNSKLIMFSKCGAAQSKRHSFHFNYPAEICGCYSHVCRQVGPHLNVNEAEICQKYRFRSLQVLCLSSRRQPKLIVLLQCATVLRRKNMPIFYYFSDVLLLLQFIQLLSVRLLSLYYTAV